MVKHGHSAVSHNSYLICINRASPVKVDFLVLALVLASYGRQRV